MSGDRKPRGTPRRAAEGALVELDVSCRFRDGSRAAALAAALEGYRYDMAAGALSNPVDRLLSSWGARTTQLFDAASARWQVTSCDLDGEGRLRWTLVRPAEGLDGFAFALLQALTFVGATEAQATSRSAPGLDGRRFVMRKGWPRILAPAQEARDAGTH